MDLVTVAKIVSVVRDVVTTLAVFIGAAWAFYRFVLKRETAWNLVIEATPTFHSYERDLALLSAEIVLKNVGQVKIRPSGVGCKFSLGLLPADKSVAETPHWKESTSLLKDYDVLRFANPRLEGLNIADHYWIEPGAHYVETINVVVPQDVILMAEVVFGAGHGEEIWIYKVWRTPTFATDGSGPVVAPVNGASKINS